MRATLLPNGRLLIPAEAEDPDQGEGLKEIGPEHPNYGKWLPFAEEGEDPRETGCGEQVMRKTRKPKEKWRAGATIHLTATCTNRDRHPDRQTGAGQPNHQSGPPRSFV